MARFTRRSLIAGAAAVAAKPALAQRAPAPAAIASVDVVIVGAGAAGIAAARRIAASQRSFSLIEAGNRMGGRCLSETASFGVPFDRGANLIYAPDNNPLTKLVTGTGLDIYRAPSGQNIRIGQRNARDSELEDFLSSVVRAQRSIADAGRGRTDSDCLRILPRDLGEWQSTIEFVLGAYGTGKELREISALDYGKIIERDAAAYCRQGYGAVLAKLADGIPATLGTPVTQIDSTRGARVDITTSRGVVSARYAIVTVSTGVFDRIKFDGGLPKRHLDALAALKPGSLDRIVLELPGNPLRLQADDRVFEKSSGARTASILANVGGRALCFVEVGGRFGRELMARGHATAVEFAVEWLAHLFGNTVKAALKRTQSTRWDDEPWVRGAFSVAAPGGQWARATLREPIRDRLYLAGEATHETLWGTVNGAWESGERAANAVLRRLGPLPGQSKPKPEPKAQRRTTEPR